jgi:hypothetical protein
VQWRSGVFRVVCLAQDARCRKTYTGRRRAIAHPPLRTRAAPRGGSGAAPPGRARARARVVHSGGADVGVSLVVHATDGSAAP